jgi:hypothetical protein
MLATTIDQDDRKCSRPAPPLGLITVAAMLPGSWTVRLVDCNAASIADDDFAWADLVFTGGMLPQQADTLRLIEVCRSRGKPVVVGGPDPTSSPHIYAAADFQAVPVGNSILLATDIESGDAPALCQRSVA